MCLSAFIRHQGTSELKSYSVLGEIVGNILKDLTKGKGDYRPTVFGHSLQAPYINTLVLDTILRINETTKYKDAAKGINDGQGNLNK